jgi:hypothetical protein
VSLGADRFLVRLNRAHNQPAGKRGLFEAGFVILSDAV